MAELRQVSYPQEEVSYTRFNRSMVELKVEKGKVYTTHVFCFSRSMVELKAWHCGLELLSFAGVFVFPSVRLQSSSRRRPYIDRGSHRSLPASREQQAVGACIGLD